jgi:hypothetical protein
MEKKTKRNRKEWKWNKTIKNKYTKRKKTHYAEDVKRDRDSERKQKYFQSME